MSKVVALITMSVDGYITGPNDGPGCGLGVGGERLHNWVFGGTWHYDTPDRGQMKPDDQAWFDTAMATMGAVIGGHGTYEASDHWGDQNPWPVPFFMSLTVLKQSHRTTASPLWAPSPKRQSVPARPPARRTCTSWAAPISSGSSWRPVSSTS